MRSGCKRRIQALTQTSARIVERIEVLGRGVVEFAERDQRTQLQPKIRAPASRARRGAPRSQARI